MEDDSARDSAIADFIYAAAMLKQTPRSGFAFLGTGRESVAEHSFLTAVIGYVLAYMAGASIAKTVLLCLFHDLPEAATGDFNYVNHRYDSCRPLEALKDISRDTGFAGSLMAGFEEFEEGSGLEAQLARDADQLDLVCALRKEQAKGNDFAREWLKSAVLRIRTEWGKELCAAIMTTDPRHWWYDQVPQEWWISRS